MADKRLNLSAPLLSVRRIRSRTSIGSSSRGGSMRARSCVPFSWEDAPGQPKCSPYHHHHHDRDIEVDDEFSDANMEFSIEEFIDDESGLFTKHVENVLVDRARFQVRLSKEEKHFDDDNNDDGNVEGLKGCGLIRRSWLKSRGPLSFVAMSAIVEKHKKHLVRALTRRSWESSHGGERGHHKRTWKAALKDNLRIRQRSQSDKSEKQARSIRHWLPFPSSPHTNSPGRRCPPSEEGSFHDIHRRTFLNANRYSDRTAYRGVPPMGGLVSITTRRRGEMDEIDPLCSVGGAIHAKRIFDHDPPILNSPSGSWHWSSSTNRAGNSPISLSAIQFKSMNNWSRSPSPKPTWENDKERSCARWRFTQV